MTRDEARDRRVKRLCCVGLVLFGAIGTYGVVVGVFPPVGPGADGSLAFPLSVGGGIVGLTMLAPERRPGRPPAEGERPAARKGNRP